MYYIVYCMCLIFFLNNKRDKAVVAETITPFPVDVKHIVNIKSTTAVQNRTESITLRNNGKQKKEEQNSHARTSAAS